MAAKKKNKKKPANKNKYPVFCQMCGHNISRSRVKFTNVPRHDSSLLERLVLCEGTVRCNGCKQVFEVRITFPEKPQAEQTVT